MRLGLSGPLSESLAGKRQSFFKKLLKESGPDESKRISGPRGAGGGDGGAGRAGGGPGGRARVYTHAWGTKIVHCRLGDDGTFRIVIYRR